jgi:hypothetical protein
MGMKHGLAVTVALAPLLGGCHAALVGNLFVLAATVAIFLGTLALGRSAPRAERAPRPGSAEQSQS